MRIAILYFPRKQSYERLKNVLVYSASVHMPAAAVDILTPDMSSFYSRRNDRRNKRIWDNLVKMQEFNVYLHKQPEGEKIIFMDCDMLITGDLREAFAAQPFEIAYTTTGRTKEPINTGVIFVRNNPYSREFFSFWTSVCNEMYVNIPLHKEYRFEKQFYGISQAGLGRALEMYRGDCVMGELPTRIYNQVSPDYPFYSQARAIHYKSRLRKETISKRPKKYPELVKLWHSYERRALAESVQAPD